MSEQRGHVPYAQLSGGPRDGLVLAEIGLTTDNLAGYRKTAETHEHPVTGPRGGVTVYQLKVWRYAGA